MIRKIFYSIYAHFTRATTKNTEVLRIDNNSPETKKIKYYLYNYNNINSKIEQANQHIESYKKTIDLINETWTDLPAHPLNGMPSTHSYGEDKTLNTITKKDNEINKMELLISREKSRIEEALRYYRAISLFISECNEKQEKIITLYYFKRNTCIETCYLARMGKTTFRRENLKIINSIFELLNKEE